MQLFLRFYQELNDFLPLAKRKKSFCQTFAERNTIKDIIESQGVPHTEVDLILVNGQSVDFTYQPKNNDRVSVYPVFELLNISNVTKLRPKPLRKTRFILDVHLGKLARYLRLLGFDTFYDNKYHDAEIIDKALKQKRIILTRDVGLLKTKRVTHGYFLRATDPKKQIQEVLNYFDLYKNCQPFSRCLECNGEMKVISKKHKAVENAPSFVKAISAKFYQCKKCSRLYWQGTHYKKLAAFVREILS